MKAIVLTGIRQMELRDVPEPAIEKDTDVLLKVEWVGVSDVELYCYLRREGHGYDSFT